MQLFSLIIRTAGSGGWLIGTNLFNHNMKCVRNGKGREGRGRDEVRYSDESHPNINEFKHSIKSFVDLVANFKTTILGLVLSIKKSQLEVKTLFLKIE